ncbi:hypothetical protein GOP47_0012059 [Adiantum capillus-veneris]|uniref:Uncharacterized protein n=1 Tax=Adiantum capillus-veneris TaxID=13818 RepID=A0A9D4UU07_ADICA|nr:hypothetical protein GOP47_0012059 [Adiantum capillus-veneris]
MEEEYDEELEKLLGEISRATSISPHLEQQRTAVKDNHHPSSEQVSQVDTPSDEMQTVRHHPLLYAAYLEPLHTSLRMGTPAYDDLPPSSYSLCPFYGGLPASGYNAMAFDKHVNSQSKHSFDLGSTYIGSLSQTSSGYVNYPGQLAVQL